MENKKIFSIKELTEMSKVVIPIPDFTNEGVIYVQVQRPRLMDMARQGKIPNHLLDIAAKSTGAKVQTEAIADKELLKQTSLMMELYCQACLIKPTYKEFAPIMTDEQGSAIFSWAMGGVAELDKFREESADDTDDKNVDAVQGATE